MAEASSNGVESRRYLKSSSESKNFVFFIYCMFFAFLILMEHPGRVALVS